MSGEWKARRFWTATGTRPAEDGTGWEVELARPSGAKSGALRVILPEG